MTALRSSSYASGRGTGVQSSGSHVRDVGGWSFRMGRTSGSWSRLLRHGCLGCKFTAEVRAELTADRLVLHLGTWAAEPPQLRTPEPRGASGTRQPVRVVV